MDHLWRQEASHIEKCRRRAVDRGLAEFRLCQTSIDRDRRDFSQQCDQRLQEDSNVATNNWSPECCQHAIESCRLGSGTGTVPTVAPQPNAVTYGTLASCGGWQHSLMLLGEAKQLRLHNLVTCSSCISACETASEWQTALILLWEVVQSPRLSPDVIIVNSAISACEASSQWEDALVLLGELAKVMVQPTLITYNASISACGKASRWEVVTLLITEIELQDVMPDTITYNSAMNACRIVENWTMALALLRTISTKHLQTDTVSYTVAMSVCERAAQWEYACELLQEMDSLQVEANQLTCNAVISSCEKAAKWEEALLLLEDATTRRFMDVIAFNAAISACISGRLMALALLQEMFHCGLRPSIVTYNSAISVCEKAVEWKQAIAVLQLLKSEHSELDIITYNAVLSACQKSAQWQRALLFFAELQEQGLEPTIITCNASISACEEFGQWTQALYLLSLAESMDVISFNAAIGACEKASQWREALHLFFQASTIANGNTITSVTIALSKSMQWILVMQLLEDAFLRQSRPNAIAYGALLQSYEIAGSGSDHVLWMLQKDAVSQLENHAKKQSAEMQEQRVAPGVDTFRALIQAQAVGSHWQRVITFLEEMQEMGLGHDSETLRLSMEVLIQKPEAKSDALRLYRQVEGQQLKRPARPSTIRKPMEAAKKDGQI
eukprot:symbB.v1.2.038896.t1/scaffold6229.1/size19837/2